MNFLNPLALLGLAAASIPVLLHLLNLRKLRTVDFSTLRFLEELRQTQVRRLKLQQILLLILRTLLIVFAVLAIARPTIPGSLPLLSATSRSSVVILVDNSGSMEAADARGPRLRQAKEAARQIIDGLRDGDEVVVLPMTGVDRSDVVAFSRTFSVAREQAERIVLTEGTADLPTALRSVSSLLLDATHAHREIYVISDAQRSIGWRAMGDSGRVLDVDASVFLVRIGNGQRGLEQNLSVDSVRVITALPQPDKPLEVEATVRNGSERDATEVLVSLSFNGTRVAQRAIDVPAGQARSVTLAAPPQRSGLIAAAVELENDAIDRDNVRWAGITIPERARVGMVGPPTETVFVRTVLSLPGMERNAPLVRSFATIGEAAPAMGDLDVVILCGGALASSDASVLRQFAEAGGGVVLFASDQSGHAEFLGSIGLAAGEILEAPSDAPYQVTTTDRKHPLFAGVFRNDQDNDRVVETPRIFRLRPATGGVDIVQTGGGALVSEQSIGRGRFIYVGVGPTMTWSTYPVTGLFAAFVVRSVLYCVAPRDGGVDLAIGDPVRLSVPARYAGSESFLVEDVNGVVSSVRPVLLPTATMVNIPPQMRAGVVKVTTPGGTPVLTATVNASMTESRLEFHDAGAWKEQTLPLVTDPDHVVELDATRSMRDAVMAARTGSELWPLFIVCAILCALAEMFVARFMARDMA